MSQISFNTSFPRSTKLTDSHSEKNSFSWLKIDAIGMYFDRENKEAAEKLLEAIELRKKYINILNSKTTEVPQSSKLSPCTGPHSPELPSMRIHHHHSHHREQQTATAATVIITPAPEPITEWRRGPYTNEERGPWNAGFHSRPQGIPTKTITGRADDDGEEDFIGSAPAFRSIASIAERFEAHMQNSAKKATGKVLAAIPLINGSSTSTSTSTTSSSSSVTKSSSRGYNVKGFESGSYHECSPSPGGGDDDDDETFMLSPPLSGKSNGKMRLGEGLEGSEGSPTLEDIENQLGVGEDEIRAKTDAFIKLLPDYVDFIKDKDAILRICTNGPVVSYSRSRLNILEYKFTFYKLLNSEYERVLLKDTPADRTTVARVDTRK